MPEVVTNTPIPWYRQPLVWLVISIPASAVVMGVTMMWISVQSFDGMVDDDYYRRGLEINRDLSRDAVAVQRGLRAALHLDIEKQIINVEIGFGDQVSSPPPARVKFRLIHPTRAGLDRTLLLERSPAGDYWGQVTPLAPGNWRVQLETETWRLSGRMPVPGTGRVDLSPLP